MANKGKMIKCIQQVEKNKDPFKLIYGWAMQKHVTETEFVALISLALMRGK